MKIFVATNGDHNVGISGTEVTIDWPEDFKDKEWREQVRKDLKGYFQEALDDKHTNVYFEDELKKDAERANREYQQNTKSF